MRFVKEFWFASSLLILLNLTCGQVSAAANNDGQAGTVWERSKDSHAFDEFPTFDSKPSPKTEDQSSSKSEAKAAHKQIEESIQNDSEKNLAPKTS